MITKCFFDDDKFITRNNNIVVVSSETSYMGHIKIEIVDKNGKVENEIVIDGNELGTAIKNCLNGRNPWNEF